MGKLFFQQFIKKQFILMQITDLQSVVRARSQHPAESAFPLNDSEQCTNKYLV